METLAASHCKITFSEWHYQLLTIINQGKWIRLDYRTYCGLDYVDDHSRGHFVCTGWRKPLRGLLTREMNHQLSKTTFMIIYIYIFISLHKCYLSVYKRISVYKKSSICVTSKALNRYPKFDIIR